MSGPFKADEEKSEIERIRDDSREALAGKIDLESTGVYSGNTPTRFGEPPEYEETGDEEEEEETEFPFITSGKVEIGSHFKPRNSHSSTGEDPRSMDPPDPANVTIEAPEFSQTFPGMVDSAERTSEKIERLHKKINFRSDYVAAQAAGPGDLPGEPSETWECVVCGGTIKEGNSKYIEKEGEKYCDIHCYNDERAKL